MHWYKRDPDAALAGMSELNFEERGAYNTILDLLYSRDGNLPDDDCLIARLCQCQPRTWRRMKSALMRHGKIWVNEGRITGKRVEDTLKKASEQSVNQSIIASKKWEQIEKAKEINDPPMPPGNPPRTRTRTKTRKKAAAEEPPEFLDFWNSIPDRGAQRHNRHTALIAYLGAVEEGANVFQINAAAKRWNRDNLDTKDADRKYIPQATTWLNQKRFLDYHTKPEQESNLEYDSDAKRWKWKAGHEPQTTN